MPVEKWVCAKKSLSDIDLILVFVESGIILSNCVNDSLKSFGIYLNSFFVRFCPKRLKESKSPNIKMLCFICLCRLFVLQPTLVYTPCLRGLLLIYSLSAIYPIAIFFLKYYFLAKPTHPTFQTYKKPRNLPYG